MTTTLPGVLEVEHAGDAENWRDQLQANQRSSTCAMRITHGLTAYSIGWPGDSPEPRSPAARWAVPHPAIMYC